MDPKYVAILVLIVFGIDRGTCETDCESLKKCMNNFGATFDHLSVNLTEKAGVMAFLDDICNKSNIEAMLQCYSPQNMIGCSVLRTFVKRMPTVESLRDQMTTACSQKEELYLVSQCLTNSNVTKAIQSCSSSIVKTSSAGKENKAETVCEGMLLQMKCVETSMTGHCPESTVNFLKTYSQQQYDDYCSISTKLTANALLICLLSAAFLFLFK